MHKETCKDGSPLAAADLSEKNHRILQGCFPDYIASSTIEHNIPVYLGKVRKVLFRLATAITNVSFQIEFHKFLSEFHFMNICYTKTGLLVRSGHYQKTVPQSDCYTRNSVVTKLPYSTEVKGELTSNIFSDQSGVITCNA